MASLVSLLNARYGTPNHLSFSHEHHNHSNASSNASSRTNLSVNSELPVGSSPLASPRNTLSHSSSFASTYTTDTNSPRRGSPRNMMKYKNNNRTGRNLAAQRAKGYFKVTEERKLQQNNLSSYITDSSTLESMQIDTNMVSSEVNKLEITDNDMSRSGPKFLNNGVTILNKWNE